MDTETRHVTVEGESEIRATPNRVVLALGIETSNHDLPQAKQVHDEILQKALSVTKAHGIAPNRVQSDYISIEPKYRQSKRDELYYDGEFLGYFVRKTILITSENIEDLQSLLTELLQAGVNYVHSIDFQTTDLKKYRDEARIMALKAAQAKAELLANVLQQKIGKPLIIREDKVGWGMWTKNFEWGFTWSGGMRQNRVSMERELSEAESVATPGSVVITAKVTVTFELTD